MPKLFMLSPNFPDKALHADHLFYCPDCAVIEGVLKYYPELKEHFDINYIGFSVPRKELVELIGDKYQGCPVLIFHKDEMNEAELKLGDFLQSGDYFFLNKTKTIGNYFGNKYKVGHPH